jgi:hypothetical protein
MSRKVAQLLITLLVLGGMASAALGQSTKRQYTMDDLAALAKRGNWAELLAHADDVRPADRGESWNELVQRAVRGWLDKPELAADPARAAFVAHTLVERFPALKRDKKLMKRRAEVGMQAYRKCFANPYWAVRCEEGLRVFVQQDRRNTALALQAAKLVRRTMQHHMAIPYFHDALFAGGKRSTRLRAKICADRDLGLAAISALALRPGTARVKPAQAIAFGPCWSELESELVKAVATGTEYARKNTCGQLLEKGVLRGLKQKRCQRVLQAK